MNEQFELELTNHLRTFSTNPYLFIGSGLSRRYYNLPTWEDLLNKFFKSYSLPGEFNYHLSKHEYDLLKVSSELATIFHETWWREPKYKKSREKNADDAKTTKQFPFKFELSEMLKSLSTVNKTYSEEIDAFSKSIIEGVITTNWDIFLETLFKEYRVYIGQQQLLFTESISIGEIYKIHGCISAPNSIVVTEEDYDLFKERNAYLAAKLLTLFVEHPIIFIGYSLSDPNILEIISSIVKCVDKDNLSKLKDRLIFVEWAPGQDSSFRDGSLLLKDGTVLPIKHIKLDQYMPLYNVLGKLSKRIPIKLLRKLKETVYEFVKTSNPSNKIYVGDLNDLKDSSDIEFVVGIGAAQNAQQQELGIKGYKGVKYEDIVEDVILENKSYDTKMILEQVLPEIAKGSAYVPLCKYFNEANYYDSTNKLTSTGNTYIKNNGINYRGSSMPNCFLPPKTYSKRGIESNGKNKSLEELLRNYKNDNEHALIFIPYLDKEKVDLEVLRKFLVNVYTSVSAKGEKLTTNFRKVVCLYDFLKYCNQ